MSDTTPQPLRVGLVGAGPWAKMFTGPMLAGSPDIELVGVWARRGEAAAELAGALGTRAVADFDALVESSEALAFALPPDVQAELAARAAAAGRAVLLDKPIGLDAAQAEGLVEALNAAGVVSQVILTNRYLPAMREYLDSLAGFAAYGAKAEFFGNGCIPGTYFATPWRLEQGGLLDLGPHVFDALIASLGPITDVRAVGDPMGMVLLTCTHADGRYSQAALSATTDVSGTGLVVEVYGPRGRRGFDAGDFGPQEGAAQFAAAQATITAEFAQCVRSNTAHPLDAAHALELQRLIDAAAAQVVGSR
jgi:predicted dehydrogenase